MLDGFPNFHYFHNGNSYSGAHEGMRYFIEPKKRPDPADETGKKTLSYLAATVWPEPWSIEHTDDAKKTKAEFEASQQGVDAAVAWVNEQFAKEPERWQNIPSILDCVPDDTAAAADQKAAEQPEA